MGKQKKVGFAEALGSDYMVFICSMFSCDMTPRVCGIAEFAAISAIAAINACVDYATILSSCKTSFHRLDPKLSVASSLSLYARSNNLSIISAARRLSVTLSSGFPKEQ